VRGVPGGRFVLREQAGGYALELEVGDAVRAWTLRRRPSLDPAERRMAIEALGGTTYDGAVADEGLYEQRGRVSWPEALERGHAMVELHGGELRGGFARQRVRGTGPGSHWLLVKRRDERARGGTP